MHGVGEGLGEEEEKGGGLGREYRTGRQGKQGRQGEKGRGRERGRERANRVHYLHDVKLFLRIESDEHLGGQSVRRVRKGLQGKQRDRGRERQRRRRSGLIERNHPQHYLIAKPLYSTKLLWPRVSS